MIAAQVGQVQIEQDQIGLMFACELEPEPALHRGHDLDAGALHEHSFDKGDVRQIVLDQQHDEPVARL